MGSDSIDFKLSRLSIAASDSRLYPPRQLRCFVAAFPERAGAPVTVIKVWHIIPTQPFQGSAKAVFGKRRYQQMDMICHLHIDMYLAVMLFTGSPKFSQIKTIIRIAAEYLGTIVTEMQLAGNDYSGETSHERNPVKKHSR
jgi:hypothetical protein